jgi:hypothetical protein
LLHQPEPKESGKEKGMLVVWDKEWRKKGEARRQAILGKLRENPKVEERRKRRSRLDHYLKTIVERSSYTLLSSSLLSVFLHRGAGDTPAVRNAGMHTLLGRTTSSPGTHS